MQTTGTILPILLHQVSPHLPARTSKTHKVSIPSTVLLAMNYVAATQTSSPGKPISVVPSSTSPTVQPALCVSSSAGTNGTRCGRPTNFMGFRQSVGVTCRRNQVSCRADTNRARDCTTIFCCTRGKHKIFQRDLRRTPGTHSMREA